MKNLYIGIMTGTSLDAVDVAICDMANVPELPPKIVHYKEYPYNPGLRDTILSIIYDKSAISLVSSAHFALSQMFADCINNSLSEAKLNYNEIRSIGMHGQTVWHSPRRNELTNFKIGSTLQLGSVPALAALTKINTIGDFRSADVALGGEGAPLVPIFDYSFFASNQTNVAVLNIGGIANLTFLPISTTANQVVAFDTGPGNVLIDYFVQKYFDKPFDRNGDIAKSGRIVFSLLNELMAHPYIKMKPPKSTGRELFNHELIIKALNEREVPPNDLIATLSAFTAKAITYNINEYFPQCESLVVSGGGINNIYILEKISSDLPHVAINNSEDFGIPSSAKEAICFAYLAWLRDNGLPSNLKSVTGAIREMPMGALSLS